MRIEREIQESKEQERRNPSKKRRGWIEEPNQNERKRGGIRKEINETNNLFFPSFFRGTTGINY